MKQYYSAFKKYYYTSEVSKFEHNIKQTWNIIEEVIDKKKIHTNKLPKNNYYFEENAIANGFNFA